jgi:hypothetical protein
MAHRFQKGEGHSSSDDYLVDLSSQIFYDADLAGHFFAAQHSHERTGRIGDRSFKILDLPFHEKSGDADRNKFGDAGDRGMTPVGRAEGVIDVNIRQLGQSLGKIFVIRLLAGMKPRFSKSITSPLHLRRASTCGPIQSGAKSLLPECLRRFDTGARLYLGMTFSGAMRKRNYPAPSSIAC